MTKRISTTFFFGIVMLWSTMINSQKIYAQTEETTSPSIESSNAIQFQLIGGIGVYYIGGLNGQSHFRIGADILLNNADLSGSGDGYSINTSGPPTSTSSSSYTRKPDESHHSFQINVSTLYLHTVAEYLHTSLYCGIGPSVSYSSSLYENSWLNTNTNSGGTYTYQNTNTTTSRARSVGPLALIGLRSQIINHVGLSAEIGLSAMYGWRSETYLYNSSNTSTPNYTNTNTDGSSSNTSGWLVAINSVRIGVIINL